MRIGNFDELAKADKTVDIAIRAAAFVGLAVICGMFVWSPSYPNSAAWIPTGMLMAALVGVMAAAERRSMLGQSIVHMQWTDSNGHEIRVKCLADESKHIGASILADSPKLKSVLIRSKDGEILAELNR